MRSGRRVQQALGAFAETAPSGRLTPWPESPPRDSARPTTYHLATQECNGPPARIRHIRYFAEIVRQLNSDQPTHPRAASDLHIRLAGGATDSLSPLRKHSLTSSFHRAQPRIARIGNQVRVVRASRFHLKINIAGVCRRHLASPPSRLTAAGPPAYYSRSLGV